MPELPEVETVRRSLEKVLINKKIQDINIIYPKVFINNDKNLLKEMIKEQKINKIERRGKWLIFVLDDYYLLSHLRMEGKYFLKEKNTPYDKHDLITFILDNEELCYNDVRKFGRMLLIKKDEVEQSPISKLGLEPWDGKLTSTYLKSKYQNKKLPIKTVLLDQNIITGIGNIYADEILFLSKINPLKKASDLNEKERDKIIKNTQLVLEKAIENGGTTIKTYTSLNGVKGHFQEQLLVHGKSKSKCPVCNHEIVKIKVNGRGTYYCPTCQK